MGRAQGREREGGGGRPCVPASLAPPALGAGTELQHKVSVLAKAAAKRAQEADEDEDDMFASEDPEDLKPPGAQGGGQIA